MSHEDARTHTLTHTHTHTRARLHSLLANLQHRNPLNECPAPPLHPSQSCHPTHPFATPPADTKTMALTVAMALTVH